MNKKLKIIIGIIISIIILLGVIFFVDYKRVSNFKEPIFVIHTHVLKDGGSYTGYGLGYRVDVKKNISAENGISLESVEMYIFNHLVAGAVSDTNSAISNGDNVQSNANNTEDYKKYSKTIDNVKIELDIPNEWEYEEMPKNEENDFYKYALKIYKNNENQYGMLYFYNDIFGVCGNGRTTKNITLNNGGKAIIGYYDGNKNWEDISFDNINRNIAILNYGLVDDEAEEVIEFIKTINITENNSDL